MAIAIDKNPQRLLSRGNVFFAKYHITGSDNMNSKIILKSLFNDVV